MDYNAKVGMADIKKRLTSLARRGRQFELDVQSVIEKIATHSKYTSDCSKFDKLLNEVLKGTIRRMLIVKAVMDYTPIVIDVKQGKFHARIAQPGTKHDKPYDLDGLKNHPWFDRAETKRDPEMWDWQKATEDTQKFRDRLAKHAKEDDMSDADRARIRALIDQITAGLVKADAVVVEKADENA